MSEKQPLVRKKSTLDGELPSVRSRIGGKVLADNRAATAQLQASRTSEPNRTGLPDGLKAGTEALAGMRLDHVRVHYNSDRPAQLNAHAYAQGADIHLASGQEQHLPHEAWHVVQQQQGRVRATEHSGGVAVNADAGLEREADAMGAKAASAVSPSASVQMRAAPINHPVVQRVWGLVKGDPVEVTQGGQKWHGAIEKVDGAAYYDVRVGGTDAVHKVPQNDVAWHGTAAAMRAYKPVGKLPKAEEIAEILRLNAENEQKVQNGYTVVGHHGTHLGYVLSILKTIEFFDHKVTPGAPKSSKVANAYGPGFYVDTGRKDVNHAEIGSTATHFASEAAFGAPRAATDAQYETETRLAERHDRDERDKWKAMVSKVEKEDLDQGLRRAVVLKIWMKEGQNGGYADYAGERVYGKGGVASLVATIAPAYIPKVPSQLASGSSSQGK